MVKSFVRAAAAAAAMAFVPSWGITFQTLYTFPEDTSDGRYPETTLTLGPDGNLYGTATEGGALNAGTVFRITPQGDFTLLASFDPASTGKLPRARLLNVGDGYLYGATEQKTAGAGTVYRLDPANGGVTTIHDFSSLGSIRMPGSLASGENGVLHVLCANPAGVLRLPLDGGTATTPSVFNSPADVAINPTRFVRGTDGRLYGTGSGSGNSGGSPYEGTIFRVNGDGTGITTLFNFDYETTGGRPAAGLAVAPDGLIYGVTPVGGNSRDGVVFRFDPAQFNPGTPGSGYTILKHLNGTPSSVGDLLLASDNKLYGTSAAYGKGFVWRINRDGSGFQTLVTFSGANGLAPFGGLVQGPDGFLYGTTRTGSGAKVSGTIFKIDLNLPTPPINHRPLAVADFVTATNNVTKDIDVLANDYDADQDPRTLVISIVQNPTQGTATVQDGKIVYNPTTFTGSDELRYKITDADGLESSTTVFISTAPTPSSWQATTYSGLVNLDPNLEGDSDIPKGQLTFKVSAKRSFTGKLTTNGAKVSVRGVIAANDLAIAQVRLPKLGKAWLVMTPAQGNIMGVFVFGAETWSGAVAPALPGTTSVVEPFTAGFLPSTPGLPAGAGYGVTKILPTGLMSIVGKTGDGAILRCSTARVSWNGDAVIPIYATPTRNGRLAGYLEADMDGGVAIFSGQLAWLRPLNTARNAAYPAGFSGTTETYFYPFTPATPGAIPLSLGADNLGHAEISGPQFSGLSTGTFEQVGSRLKCAGELRSISLNRKTGLFNGKMKTPEGKTVTFTGSIIQAHSYGLGLFLLNKETGNAHIASELD